MVEGASIRVWTRDTAPERFRRLARLRDDAEAEDTVFVAHVPATILADRTYRLCNGESGTEGWIREGELGLFGINALDTFPDPDGDGILIVGSAI